MKRRDFLKLAAASPLISVAKTKPPAKSTMIIKDCGNGEYTVHRLFANYQAGFYDESLCGWLREHKGRGLYRPAPGPSKSLDDDEMETILKAMREKWPRQA